MGTREVGTTHFLLRPGTVNPAMASENDAGVVKRKVTVYTKDTYNRVSTVTRTSSEPKIMEAKPALQKDHTESPINDPQVHQVHTSVDHKVVDGQFVRTEKQVEQAAKEDFKEHVEAVKQ